MYFFRCRARVKRVTPRGPTTFRILVINQRGPNHAAIIFRTESPLTVSPGEVEETYGIKVYLKLVDAKNGFDKNVLSQIFEQRPLSVDFLGVII